MELAKAMFGSSRSLDGYSSKATAGELVLNGSCRRNLQTASISDIAQ